MGCTAGLLQPPRTTSYHTLINSPGPSTAANGSGQVLHRGGPVHAGPGVAAVLGTLIEATTHCWDC